VRASRSKPVRSGAEGGRKPSGGEGLVARSSLPVATPAASAVKNSPAAPSLETSCPVSISSPLPTCHPRSNAKEMGFTSRDSPYKPMENRTVAGWVIM